MTVCPTCGHENVPEAKFCSECGSKLAAEPSAARTERKVVTVLFADLVGFTAQAERLDPEDVQAILRPYHGRLRHELERFGGTVEKFIGDAVMALFGAPTAHEDDPERAVRAALAIRDWIAEEGKLQVRVGINTGEALVNLGARQEAGEGMAAGDVVNTAARLQTAAPPNGVVVGETTCNATAHTIDYREPRTIKAKGKEEALRVYEVVQARARFGVDVAPRPTTALIGRDRELELLKGTLTRAIEQPSTELVTLIGVPGIGKSRLVAELFAAVDTGKWGLVFWRQGRSLPYGEGVSYWALAEMVKAQAGILETDSAEDAEAKLTRAVEDLIEDDAGWVHSHLLPLVGQGSEAAGVSREETFAAWRRFFEALAEQRPIVLIFEDIQWADDGLLDFVEHLVDWVRGVPMLILCTARLELLERRPQWGGGKLNAATVALAPLSDEETADLISILSERPLMEAEMQSTLLERAGGNPLYAEQYVRMLAERETAEDVPESVQGIIAARLDSLPTEEKALLQDAAVVGKVFWLGALGATEQQLHALTQKEFVQRARRSSVAGETEFAFKHLLVRDVAYGQIPRAERAQKHLHAAEWIESLGRPEDHAEMVAHHYANALELARAAGQGTDGVAGKALTAFREAGDRALALNALEQAETYYAQALALTSFDERSYFELLLRHATVLALGAGKGADELLAARDGLLAAGNREAAAEAELQLADLAWNEGRGAAAKEHSEAARVLVASSPPSRVHATVLTNIARYHMLADRAAAAIEVGREALKMAEQLGLDHIRSHALNNVGVARILRGDVDGLADLEESIEIAARLHLPADLSRGYNNLATMKILLGRIDESEADVAESVRIARHFGLHGSAQFGSGGPTIAAHYGAGRWDEAVAAADTYLADAGEDSYQASGAHIFRGLVRVARDDEVGAAADAEAAIASARRAGDPQVLVPVLANAAVVYLEVGDRDTAANLLDETLDELRALPDLGFPAVELPTAAWLARAFDRSAEVLEIAEGEVLQSPWLRAGQSIAAGDLRTAADVFNEIGARVDEAFCRLRAAQQLASEGHRSEADAQLQPALAFFRSVRATRYVREGEALLAASA
jgi:class 3 adenylate cyclase/tetratricopeptide (TPR) repeat protein